MSTVTTRNRTLAMGEDEANSGGRAMVNAPFGKALARIAKDNPAIVGLTADLGKYTDIHPFRDANHRRAAGADHRLWRHPSGHRGCGADAHDSGSGRD